LATGLNTSNLKTSFQKDNEAILGVAKVKLSKLKKLILEGKIECGITIAALNLFFLKYDK